jgi:resuscitation-promoting factor RpfB
MASNAKGIAAGAVFVGGLLAWSGVKGKKWTTGLRDLIAGKSPVNAPGTPITGNGTYADEIASATGNTGAATQTAAHNQSIARMLTVPFGWSTGQEWDDLVSLWNQESGWSNTAENPSGAYGVAQALPNTKYPLPGRPPNEGGSADPTTQIAWGLAYILGRYGTPSGAWAHEQQFDWY